MHKIYLANGKVYNSEDIDWMKLPNEPITQIDFYLSKNKKIVFKGWDQYVILKEIEAIIGQQKPTIVSMTVLAKYEKKCYQFTQNIIWGKIAQSINEWGVEYRPMSFNWKKQQWTSPPGRPINPIMWHVGELTDDKPTCKLEKI